MPIHAHKLVDSVANGLANELFDIIMSNNANFGRFKELASQLGDIKSQASKYPARALKAKFIAQAKPLLLEEARATLAKMLTTPIDESLKATIAEALILDNELRGHREGPIH